MRVSVVVLLCSLLALATVGTWKFLAPRIEGCARYSSYVEDGQSYNQLIAWADEYIFSREFDLSETWVGNAVGPGRLGAFRPDDSKFSLPSELAGLELRPLGKELSRPDGIFVGHASFRGLVIARTSIEDAFANSRMSLAAAERRHGRVALVCVSPR